MPFSNPIVLSDKDVSRIPVVLDGLDPEDFTAGDCFEFVFAGKLWLRDDDDTTSPSDGITVFVTSDSVRFKSNGLNSPERGYCSVLDFVDDVPGSLSVGDIYGIVAAPAAGDFAAHGNAIATCLKAGVDPIFAFTDPPWPGFFVYSQALPGYRSWTGSAWQDGLGLVYAAASIPAEALKVPRFIVQATVTAPPGSPADGNYWLGGSGCTGAFAGWDNRIIKRVGTSWVSFVPSAGWKLFNLNTQKELQYLSGIWSQSGQPKIVGYPARVVRSGTVALSGSSPGQATAPTNASGALIFPEGTSSLANYTLAKTANALLVRGRLDLTSQTGAMCIGVFVDGAVTCSVNNWFCTLANGAANGDLAVNFEFEISVGNINAHTYNVRGYGGGTVQRGFLQFVEIER